MKPLPSLPNATDATPGLSASSYAYLRRLVLNESGIALDDTKHYLIQARLRPIMTEHGYRSLDELAGVLMSRSSAGLTKNIVEAMTTHETLFFRDGTLFEALRHKVLPELLKKLAGKRTLRLWSAAASTGQEAYSLAVLLLQVGFLPSQVEILATDLSRQVLKRAKDGRYLQCEVNRGLTPELLHRYFVRQEADWVVKDEVKRMVTFQEWDLRRDPRPLGCFDLIFCRNVLIYFDRETKQKVLRSLAGSLYEGGSVVLGCAETTLDVSVSLERKVVENAAFYQRAVS